jgi:hypothetical protein
MPLVKLCPLGLSSFTGYTVTNTFLCCIILFILSIYQNSYRTMQFILVTTRTRTLTTFLECWGPRVFCDWCACTEDFFFPVGTPIGSINLGSRSRKLLITRLLHPCTWGLPSHYYERPSNLRREPVMKRIQSYEVQNMESTAK